jgi:AraC-like DNA-binding protein
MPLDDGTAYRIREDGHFSVPDDTNALMTAAWTIEWQIFSPRRENAVSETEPPDIPLPRSCDSALRTLVESVVRLLMLDVARQWKVGELARETGLSTRSLQRRLGGAQLSLTRLVRLVRIHEACRLLKNTDAPLTTIGFCAGFSDSAHFSRDFRASTGMTPSDYRAAWTLRN